MSLGRFAGCCPTTDQNGRLPKSRVLQIAKSYNSKKKKKNLSDIYWWNINVALVLNFVWWIYRSSGPQTKEIAKKPILWTVFIHRLQVLKDMLRTYYSPLMGIYWTVALQYTLNGHSCCLHSLISFLCFLKITVFSIWPIVGCIVLGRFGQMCVILAAFKSLSTW